MNKRMVEMTGHACEDLIGRSIHEFLEYPTPARSDGSTGTGPPDSGEVRLRRSDGALQWVLRSENPLRNPEGRLIGSVISIADITKRRCQELDAVDRDRRFRAVFDNATPAMLIVDEQWRCLDANAAALRLLGRDLRELREVPVTELGCSDLRSWVEGQANSTRQVDATVSECRVQRADGEERMIECSRVVRILPGQHLLVMRDITERVFALRKREELETQLQQAQRLESMGKLAGGIAHDFNNLLSIILNHAAYAQEQSGGGRLRDEIDAITDAANRAAGLTRQLLTFSRRDPHRPVVIDLVEQLTATTNLLRRTLGAQVAIELAATAGPVWVEIDEAQFDQVLVNLALNARDAMPNGGVLSVRLKPQLSDGMARAVLSVSDTGAGMRPDVAARAFEPFFTTKSRETSTGLGLATVYGIVTRSHGTISLSSTHGSGTEVTIVWPCAEPPEAAGTSDARSSDWPGGTATREVAVLLVEDEVELRDLVARMLTDSGFCVVRAGRAEDALRLVHEETFDIVISDVVMPGMSGTELAAKLRAVGSELPVLLISGYGQYGDEQPGTPTRVLMKPFTRAELLSAVELALAV